MDKQITRLTLDVGLRDSYKVVFAKMGDTERRVIAEIKDNGEEYSLTGVNTVEVRCRKADGKQVTKNATKENNTVVIDISGQMTTCKGTAIVDVVLYGTSGGVLSTAKFYLNVDDGAVSEDEIKSSNEYESLTDALRVVGLSKEVAETALTTANEALDTAGEAIAGAAEAKKQAEAANTAAAEAKKQASAANTAAAEGKKQAAAATTAAAEAKKQAEAATEKATAANNAAAAAEKQATAANSAAAAANEARGKAVAAAQSVTEQSEKAVNDVKAAGAEAAQNLKGYTKEETNALLRAAGVHTQVGAPIYGVKRVWNTENVSDTWERTDASVGMEANPTIGTKIGKDDFSYVMPWAGIVSKCCDLDTGGTIAYIGEPGYDPTKYMVLTEYPGYYLKRWRDDTYEYVQISAGAFDGAVYIEPWEWGRYPSSLMGSKHVSMSGKHPDCRINRATVRARSKAAGEGYYSMDSTSYWAYSMLVLVKYASLNTQEKVCKGYYYLRYTDQDKALVAEQSTNRIVIALATAANEYLVGNAVEIGTSLGGAQVAKQRQITRVEDYSSGSVTGKAIYFDGDPVNIAVGNIISHCANISGTTDSLGMKDGCLANDGKHAMLLLGHEHNGQYAFVDNVNRYQDKLYVCYDNTATKDNVGDTDPNYKALSFAFPTTSGWQLLEGFDPEHPLEMWCEKLGGSSVGKGNGAYLWSNNNAAWCVLYVFGSAGSGANAGLPCVGFGSGGAGWSIGGVLLKKRQ
nr:MAG TPA: tail collar fiber protein [Caudoviricetes sp.]